MITRIKITDEVLMKSNVNWLEHATITVSGFSDNEKAVELVRHGRTVEAITKLRE